MALSTSLGLDTPLRSEVALFIGTPAGAAKIPALAIAAAASAPAEGKMLGKGLFTN
jgi:hypothetical protein